VEARALDTTGNRSALQSRDLRIDTTAPVSRATYDAARDVTVRAADATSGVDRVETRIGDGEWTAYSAPLAVGEDGATVFYRSVDTAGNVEDTNEVVVPAADADLAPSAVVAVLSTDRAAHGSTVTVTARVNGAGATPTGWVRVLTGDRLVASGELADGRVRVPVDTEDLGVGQHTLVVRYDGDEHYRYATDTVTLRVTRAKSKTAVALDRSRDGSRAAALVHVSTDPSGQAPDRVKATLLRAGKVVRTRWLDLTSRGRGQWSLSALRPGTYAVSVVTATTPTLDGSSGRDRVTLRSRR